MLVNKKYIYTICQGRRDSNPHALNPLGGHLSKAFTVYLRRDCLSTTS